MIRYTLMSRLGLAEPLVRLARTIENSNRAAAVSGLRDVCATAHSP